MNLNLFSLAYVKNEKEESRNSMPIEAFKDVRYPFEKNNGYFQSSKTYPDFLYVFYYIKGHRIP